MRLCSAFNSPEDHKYFRLFTQGNERGLSYLEKRLHSYIFNYARNIIVNNFEINSILQDAFIKAWNYRANISDIQHLLNYLKFWIKWACYDWIRKSKMHHIVPAELNEQQLISIYDSAEEADQENIAQIRLELIEQAITCLPRNKEIIMTLWKSGLSYNSIAKAQNTSSQHIAVEFKKSIAHLKRINDRLAKAALAESKRPQLALADYEVYFDERQSKIFRLYYEKAYSFQKISELLHLTPFQLQRQHSKIKDIINKKLKTL